MKKDFTLFVLAMASLCTQAAVMPVASDELIEEAPAGTIVSNMLRTGYSYYYENYNLNGGYNDGFVGEYVLGDDGCIYIKNACASLPLGTYLKLDKIDDENYVAHTAQLIWVDMSGYNPYTAFATRLVFTKISDYQYTYQMEEDAEGNVLADIYFTYKDGILKQVDQEVVELNGVYYPHELIGFTNSTGGFIGYGDACLTFEATPSNKTTLPEGTEVQTASMALSVVSSTVGRNFMQGKQVKMAEVGDELYLSNPNAQDTWIKGAIDREAGTVTFLPQYVGINEEVGCHQWLIPATHYEFKDVWDEETGYGVWYRDYNVTESLVYNYADGCLSADPESKLSALFSLSPSHLQVRNAFSDIIVKPLAEEMAAPTTPEVLRLEEYNGFYASILMAIPNIDVNNTYIDPEELSFVVYLGDATQPHEFTTDDHWSILDNMTEVPYLYEDDMDFEANGIYHNIYFYQEDVTFAGVQTIYRHEGEEMRSDIAWYNYEPSAIRSTRTEKAANELGKVLKEGRVVIIEQGHEYNLQGQLNK